MAWQHGVLNPNDTHGESLVGTLVPRTGARMAIRLNRFTWAPWLVTGLMLVVSFLYWSKEERAIQQQHQVALEAVANRTRDSLQDQLLAYELVLRGVKGLVEGSDRVTALDFRRYVSSLNLPSTQPGLLALALVREVSEGNWATFEQSMQAEGDHLFRLQHKAPHSGHRFIEFIEPHDDVNRRVLGFDIGTTVSAKEAMDRARITGAAALSRPLVLVQDMNEVKPPPSLVMYVPIESGGAVSRADWVSGPFRLADFARATPGGIADDVGLSLFAGGATTAQNLLFSTLAAGAGVLPPLPGTAAERSLIYGGQRLTLRVQMLPAFQVRWPAAGHHALALVGVALSLSLGWAFWLVITQRARAEALAADMNQALQLHFADQESLLNALPDVLFELDSQGTYLKYRTSRHNLLVVPPEALLGKRMADVLSPEANAICMAALAEAQERGFSFGKEIEIAIGSEPMWFELSVSRKPDPGTTEPKFVMVSRDVTARRRAEQQLRLSNQVFNAASECTVITDADNRILSVNKAFTELTGYSLAECLGKTPSMLKSGLQDAAFYDDMWRGIRTTGRWHGEVLNRKKDGTVYPQWLSVSTVRNEQGQITQHIGMMTDLTAFKAAQDRIDHLAHYDPLTGLPNGVLLRDRGTQALTTARRLEAQVAVLALDLDRFQKVNDSLGMPAGDEVLKRVARLLTEHLHGDDTLCRQSGDEFNLLLPNTSATGAAHVADKLLQLLARPIAIGDDPAQGVNLTASMGVAIYPDNGADFEQLLHSANTALHRAKAKGGNQFEFFKEEMHGAAREALALEGQLHHAIAYDELVLYYQPQVDALSGRIVGAEALIRWQHPELGLLPPGRFIPVAEKSGLICDVGNWVLRTALRQLSVWMQEGLPVVPVAVNLSALEFKQPALCDTVQAVLQAHRVPPSLLELELTESVAMEDSAFTFERIEALHALGVKLSIDDFGTGYSSLSYLKRYKVDRVKIDQSFVRDIGGDEHDRSIVRTVVQLAHGLGATTVAEGVETFDQWAFLRANQCDVIQGYLFARPMPAEAFAAELRNGSPLQARQG